MKPAADKRVLLLLAGLTWLAVGGLLLSLARAWLNAVPFENAIPYSVVGLGVALVVHHFGFLKIVDRNLGRIPPMEGKPCVFSFISWNGLSARRRRGRHGGVASPLVDSQALSGHRVYLRRAGVGVVQFPLFTGVCLRVR